MYCNHLVSPVYMWDTNLVITVTAYVLAPNRARPSAATILIKCTRIFFKVSQAFNHCIIWWGHQIETFSALLAICAGNSPVTGEFPSESPETFSLICAWINDWLNNRDEISGKPPHFKHSETSPFSFLTTNSKIKYFSSVCLYTGGSFCENKCL